MEGEQNNAKMSVVSVVVILVVLILGGLYFWSQRTGNDTLTDEAVQSIITQSSSDETASIEADLDATDVETLDSELE